MKHAKIVDRHIHYKSRMIQPEIVYSVATRYLHLIMLGG